MLLESDAYEFSSILHKSRFVGKPFIFTFIHSFIFVLLTYMPVICLQANKWCKRGVDILTCIPLELSPVNASNVLNNIDEFISDGRSLKVYFAEYW